MPLRYSSIFSDATVCKALRPEKTRSIVDRLDGVTASGRDVVINLGDSSSVTRTGYLKNRTLANSGADDFIL